MSIVEPLKARMNALGKSLIKAAQKFGEHDMRYYAAALSYQVFSRSSLSLSFSLCCWEPWTS